MQYTETVLNIELNTYRSMLVFFLVPFETSPIWIGKPSPAIK
jgi:hypothetical protein